MLAADGLNADETAAEGLNADDADETQKRADVSLSYVKPRIHTDVNGFL